MVGGLLPGLLQQLTAAGHQIGHGGISRQRGHAVLPKIKIAAGQLVQIRGVGHRRSLPHRRKD
jgi:hypothetical protein